MTSLKIDTVGERRKTTSDSFCRRQVMPSTTRYQKIFDALFGVILPILCFIFDPIVFRDAFDDALFPEYQSYVYMVSGAEIVLLLTWLVCGQKLRPHTRLIGGLLVAGALFSNLIGLIILPFSLMGLVLGIGIFGFIPFLTALVYWRNGRSAFQLAHVRFPSRTSWGAVGLGGVLILSVPAGISLTASQLVSQSMNTVIYANPQNADMAIDQIKYLELFAPPDLDRFVSAYTAEDRPAHKEELKRRYLKLTGEDIDARLRRFAD